MTDKRLEEVIDKNGNKTRRWKGRAEKEKGQANANRLSGITPEFSTHQDVRESQRSLASSEPHLAGDDLPDDFKPFMSESIYISRNGSEYRGEMDIVLSDDESLDDAAFDLGRRYNLDRAVVVESTEEGQGVLQFRGNRSSVTSLVSEYADEDHSKVSDSLTNAYGIDDLDRSRFTVAQRRRARNTAAAVADAHEELTRAKEKYAALTEKLSEFGEANYQLRDGREVNIETAYRFNKSEFERQFPKRENRSLYEMAPKNANALKSALTKEQYESLRMPENNPRISIKEADERA